MQLHWETEQIFFSGDLFFQNLLSRIAIATRSIDLETYIFDQDTFGKRMIDSLSQAAKRGVQVRLLLDGVGSSQWNLSNIKELRDTGIEARFYHPLPWQIKDLRIQDFFRVSKIIKRLYMLNRRNHRKSCQIDGKIAFVGGMNISAQHLVEFHGKEAWRDTGVMICGPELSELQTAFEQAWNSNDRSKSSNLIHSVSITKKESLLLRINSSRNLRRHYYKDLIHRILLSKKRVWITTPYFGPEVSLLRALRYAAWSQVDVRILVPHRSDIFFMKWLAQAYYSALQRMGVRIYEYLPSVLHAKTWLIDDWAVIGSSNLNSRSLMHDLEVDVVVGKNGSIELMENQFELDLKQSREILPSKWRKRFWMRRLLEWLALKLRWWL